MISYATISLKKLSRFTNRHLLLLFRFSYFLFRNLKGRHPSGQNEEEVRLTDPDQIDAKLPPNKKDSGVYLPTDGSRDGSQDFI